MTLNEAHEYIDHALESEAEQRGEYGMGAVSLGLDPYEWAPAYDGYRTAEDPTFAEASRIVEAATPAPVYVPAVPAGDIPF